MQDPFNHRYSDHPCFNRCGFPDPTSPNGFQPALNIYAWNELGEGGIMAPTRRDGYMKLDTIAGVQSEPQGAQSEPQGAQERR